MENTMPQILFNVQTRFAKPGLHVWHNSNNLFHAPGVPLENHPGWWQFKVRVPRHQTITFKLFAWDETITNETEWESDAFNRTVRITLGEKLPDQLWFCEGSSRVLLADPFAESHSKVRVHLITKAKYLEARLHLWTPSLGNRVPVKRSGIDEFGWPYYDVTLDGDLCNAFNFMFNVPNKLSEHPSDNRTWTSADGAEIWTHSEAPDIISSVPDKRSLTIRVRHSFPHDNVRLHIWQNGHGYAEDVTGIVDQATGWITFAKDGLFTGIPYGMMLVATENGKDVWEHGDARRWFTLNGSREFWTFEGDNTLFGTEPQRKQVFTIKIAQSDPRFGIEKPDTIEVKINKAHYPFDASVERISPTKWQIHTYPALITAFKFSQNQTVEPVYHYVKSPNELKSPVSVYVITGRSPCLATRPPKALFQDPPFLIRKSGVTEEDGYLRFVFHSPSSSRVRLWGEWMAQGTGNLDLFSSLDGNYWWAQIKVSDIISGLPQSFGGDYHGAKYHFVLHDITSNPAYNQLNRGRTLQDPAAQWVETSDPDGNSRLVNHSRYKWISDKWQIPGWEYFNIYQLHVSRFTDSNSELCPFDRVTRKVEDGYFDSLGITAIQLLPVNEYGGGIGWGYNGTYFYAIENSYGGPDALKKLIDTCHCHGIAVILDIVFNHIGCGDNILYEVSRETYTSGDSMWGLMPNYDNEECCNFFRKNLVFLHQEYHIDGFRFDHTRTIIKAGEQDWFVRIPGSKRGWDFLHGLRNEVKSVNSGVFMYGEQLPSEVAISNFGGPMDSQTSEEFKEGIYKVCKGDSNALRDLASALKITHTSYDNWYKVVNYACSHDGAGNDGRRTAYVGGFGQGFRRNKVAAAALMMSRGVPFFFMGEEYGETEPFRFGNNDVLDLTRSETEPSNTRVREWWKTLIKLRKGNWNIQGSAPLHINFVEDSVIAFSRGANNEYFVILNFGPNVVWRTLGDMNLPDTIYKELLNSTWQQFQVEWENTHDNGGWNARLNRGTTLQIPDYGAVILERL
jgi:1,4-alpha-glucan branching enzyme